MNITNLHAKFLNSTGVSTDTRKIHQGSIFFALKGPNFNGNEYAQEALDKGATYVVVDKQSAGNNQQFVLVEDALTALQKLGNYHRKQFDIPILAITGSNGKTTTKELIFEVLSQKYRTLHTEGNLNNHIGLPLTLLRLDEKVQIAVIEMGANKLGDIEELCQIAEPTHGLITNIGKAHTEGFGGFEGVIRGKSELYQYLRTTKGDVFINSGDKILKNMGKRFDKPFYFPGKEDFYHCRLLAPISKVPNTSYRGKSQ